MEQSSEFQYQMKWVIELDKTGCKPTTKERRRTREKLKMNVSTQNSMKKLKYFHANVDFSTDY